MKYFGFKDNQISNSQQATKEANAKLLFGIIEKEGHISRAQLSRISGLSRSTVSVLTEEMIQNHMIMETGEGESEPTGRKPIILEIDPSGIQIPCFAFKPTGLLFVLYDLKYHVIEELFLPYGKKLERKKIDNGPKYINPPEEAVVDLFDTLMNKKSKCLKWDKVRAITVSFSGSFDWDNNTFTSSVLGWRFDSNFIDKLRERFDNIPLLVGNISALMAYAERKISSSHRENLLYINIGHGVGAGIILNDKPFTGEHGISGEIGRQIIRKRADGEETKYTHLEDVASVSTLIEKAKAGIHNGEKTILMQLCEYNIDLLNISMIGKALESGDSFTMDLAKEIAWEVSAAIANTLCVLGSMDVFIGGGLEELGYTFLEMVKKILQEIGYQRVMNHTKIHYSGLPVNGECLGAARAYVDNQLVVI